jgi:alpha-galactosidase
MKSTIIFPIYILMFLLTSGCSINKKNLEFSFSNNLSEISIINSRAGLWEFKVKSTGKALNIEGPSFEIDGKDLLPKLTDIKRIKEPVHLQNGTSEYVFEGIYNEHPDMKLKMYFRLADSNQVVRFRYELVSENPHLMTREQKSDNLTYLSATFSPNAVIKEIRLSEFNEMVHSFCLSERNITAEHFLNNSKLMGPILSGSADNHSFLLAYEHGSQVPDAFLEFNLCPGPKAELKAVKGNYYSGQTINSQQPFSTIWLEASIIKGDEAKLASGYREFILKYMTENSESRKPYIFYNTWNFQERNRNWYKKPYLADMTLERMMKEIEVAHKMGIEVFVIDAGWFEKTGDWTPSLKRFPDGLKTISKNLKDKGMKLGLWFNPTVAAVSSSMLKNHRDCVRTKNGDEGKPRPIWETEESYGMCLVSPYRDAFADELIRLYKELGVTYFKWDAIGQYECDDPRHFHGNSDNTPQERLDSYAFEIGKSMSYVVDKLVKECPDAIVDFDITEGTRTVGLGFLSSGKYFLINNGPYYFNYDIPFDRENGQWNIFFFPGPARTWICRTPLTFDKWIPSVLFLTHYLPDDPYENQSLAVGSLILGQNGIWGDLLKISAEGVGFFNESLEYYKQVRDDITKATIIQDGAVGGSPEVYEKINESTGKGAIVLFSSHKGSYEYISQRKPDQNYWLTKGVDISFDKDGHAVIKTNFNGAEAKIIFFGVDRTDLQ